MRSRARSLRRKNSLRPSPPPEKRGLCCTKEWEAGKILSSMSPGTKATTISRSGSKRLGAQVREPCAARFTDLRVFIELPSLNPEAEAQAKRLVCKPEPIPQ